MKSKKAAKRPAESNTNVSEGGAGENNSKCPRREEGKSDKEQNTEDETTMDGRTATVETRGTSVNENKNSVTA